MEDIEDDDWKCPFCSSEQSQALRALCNAAKRYVDSCSTSKSQESQSVEETTELEESRKRSKQKQRKEAKSTNDENCNADSKDTASPVQKTNRSKRKHVSSSEESSDENERKNRRKKVNVKDSEPKPHPVEKKKKKFESVIQDAINESTALHELWMKKQAAWKKNYIGINATTFDKTLDQSKEEFLKFFSDIKTSINLIEKSFTDKIAALENKSANTSEKANSSPVKETESTMNKSNALIEGDDMVTADVTTTSVTAANEDEEMADVSIASDITAEKPSKSHHKESIVSFKGPDDVSSTTFDDDNTADDDNEPAETDESTNDSFVFAIDNAFSLAVNVPSIIDSLNGSFKNELGNQKNVNETDPLVIEPVKSDNLSQAAKNVMSSSEDDEDDDDLTITEQPTMTAAAVQPEDSKESALDEDETSLLSWLQQPSSDNASTDYEKTKKFSTDSELSDVSVLHSNKDNVTKTKQKKMKTRKELNNLIPKEAKVSNDDAETSDEEKEIERLCNLESLKKRKDRRNSDSDEKATENNSAKKDENSNKKKKVEKESVASYFDKSNGNDTDSSTTSFSGFNSAVEKIEEFSNGEEDMSKKMLLEDSSDENADQHNDDDIVSISSDDEPPMSSKSNDIKLKKNEYNGESSKTINDPESSSDEFRQDKNKNEKIKWRHHRLLIGKLSETDTSDEERMIRRDKEKRQKVAERKAEKSLIKQYTRKTKRRKIIVSSSGSEFEVKAGNSDDSVQIVSDEETKFSSKIKNSDGGEKALVSTNKGRKNIKKILKVGDLAELTKQTAKEEKERKKRISERQALFNQSFEINEDINRAPDGLILDFDPETKEELIVVHNDLVQKLKPHQAKGVKFMWDSCFESVEKVETSAGGGCILAHCMGLGKTLQVITLIHTVMRYPQLEVNRVLILCPLSTVSNWVTEFEMWLKNVDCKVDINIFNLNKVINSVIRGDKLNEWFRKGGVMVMSYQMFRTLVNTDKVRKKIKEYFTESLLDPGPDLVVCDEGHMLKNEQTAISKATMKIRTKRRIVLTGTPLQNNLVEYHCMVQFVKQNLLGHKKEFLNRFVNPITNGQYMDSTKDDVRVMKRRAHVLHNMLNGVVQRFDYNVLTPFLPNKFEFVIFVSVSDLQAKLYEHYLDHYSKKVTSASTLFKDYQIMRLIWTHPYAMKFSEDRKREQIKKKVKNQEYSVVVRSDEGNQEASNSDLDNNIPEMKGDDNNVEQTSKANPGQLIDSEKKDNEAPITEDYQDVWWKSMVTEEEMNDYRMGPKLVLLFAIMQQCEDIGDKLLVFSQSIPSLHMIEHFLEKWEEMQAQESNKSEKSVHQYGTWKKGIDYFRLDGQTPPELRTVYCDKFNKTTNLRSRLFLISTKAGGLGINLTAANRVIIFDASWNPSYDVQSIFRIYRLGQSKPCYIYRFLSQGTMEEKIYERQVTKLSISCRVVDEQQIDRHFNNADIVKLYEFNRKKPGAEIPLLPKDRLMAELLKEHKNVIVGYHEHDSLLENQKEEELTEEERKQAWEDYETEKDINIGKREASVKKEIEINRRSEIITGGPSCIIGPHSTDNLNPNNQKEQPQDESLLTNTKP